MKSLKFALAAGLMVATMGAWAQSSGAPGSGITGTAHDWSSAATSPTSGGTSILLWQDSKGNSTQDSSITGTPWIDPTTGVQGVTHITIGQCTKCHTPHQSKSTNLLWNHTLSTNTYSWDVPATTAGTTYPKFVGNTYKGPTTKCLSCHDGSIASTDGIWFNRQFIKGATHASSGFDSHDVANGATGSMVGTHPVAMPYPLNGQASTYNGVTSGSMITSGEWVADPSKTNNIRLYNMDPGTGSVTAGSVAGNTGIECTSCHDVHNGTRVKDSYLVTGMISGSGKGAGQYICQQCHNK